MGVSVTCSSGMSNFNRPWHSACQQSTTSNEGWILARSLCIPVSHLLVFYTPLAVPSKLLLLPAGHGLRELAAVPGGAGKKCNSNLDPPLSRDMKYCSLIPIHASGNETRIHSHCNKDVDILCKIIVVMMLVHLGSMYACVARPDWETAQNGQGDVLSQLIFMRNGPLSSNQGLFTTSPCRHGHTVCAL